MIEKPHNAVPFILSWFLFKEVELCRVYLMVVLRITRG